MNIKQMQVRKSIIKVLLFHSVEYVNKAMLSTGDSDICIDSKLATVQLKDLQELTQQLGLLTRQHDELLEDAILNVKQFKFAKGKSQLRMLWTQFDSVKNFRKRAISI